MESIKQLTEANAATAYARAWNRLDASEFIKLLAPDARYASQWVFEELDSKQAISEYLIGKIRTVKMHSVNNAEAKVFAEIGKTTEGFSRRDCVFMAQGRKENVTAVVLFEVENDKVKRYDLCIPELLGVIRSGVYPI
jgi:hypothetical protein